MMEAAWVRWGNLFTFSLDLNFDLKVHPKVLLFFVFLNQTRKELFFRRWCCLNVFFFYFQLFVINCDVSLLPVGLYCLRFWCRLMCHEYKLIFPSHLPPDFFQCSSWNSSNSFSSLHLSLRTFYCFVRFDRQSCCLL